MKQIILASTSPRRHELARTMGLDFKIEPSGYEEDMTLKLPPKELVMMLAHGKAADVAKNHRTGIVIGVDTIVVFKNKILGKPKNKKHAFKMLKSFSGKSQEVYSGVCLIDCKKGTTISDYEVTKVKFRKLTDYEIKKYIATGEPLDKAGAYGIQDLSSIFMERIEGCYFNVVGFPIYNIYKNLRKIGVDIFKYERWRNRK
ncbi:Maf family protein [Candidatus Woesearchaeota archaeon]|nr:Maf family protein [Candidatus Woesearchaeota archaeon]